MSHRLSVSLGVNTSASKVLMKQIYTKNDSSISFTAHYIISLFLFTILGHSYMVILNVFLFTFFVVFRVFSHCKAQCSFKPVKGL